MRMARRQVQEHERRPVPLSVSDGELAAVGTECEVPDRQDDRAGVADVRSAVPGLRGRGARARVEERDAAVVAADCEHAPVRAKRVVEDATATRVQDPERSRAAQQGREQVAPRRFRVVERDPRAGEQERTVESLLRQRLRAQALRDRRRRLPLRATAGRERDATGDQRRQQENDGCREQCAQPPVRARERRAALLEEFALETVQPGGPLAGGICPLERRSEPCAAVQLARLTS